MNSTLHSQSFVVRLKNEDERQQGGEWSILHLCFHSLAPFINIFVIKSSFHPDVENKATAGACQRGDVFSQREGPEHILSMTGAKSNLPSNICSYVLVFGHILTVITITFSTKESPFFFTMSLFPV